MGREDKAPWLLIPAPERLASLSSRSILGKGVPSNQGYEAVGTTVGLKLLALLGI
jgi:hypothetical protein